MTCVNAMTIGMANGVHMKDRCANVMEFHRITKTKYAMVMEIVSAKMEVDMVDMVLGLEDTEAVMGTVTICLRGIAIATEDGGENFAMKILLLSNVTTNHAVIQLSVPDMENVKMTMFVSATKNGTVLDAKSMTNHQIATDIGLDMMECVMVMVDVCTTIIVFATHDGWVRVVKIL